MRSRIKIICLLIFLNLSCSGEENIEEIDTNSPPEAFSLNEVANEGTYIALLPEFSWGNANDPDGDPINYTLLLDTENNPTEIIAENIPTNSYALNESLENCTTYFWRIRAEDSNGGITMSEIFSFETRALDFSNATLTTNAEFSKRRGHTTSVYNNKLWVIGGDVGALNKTNDVWTSENGNNWKQVNNDSPFEARSGHSSLVFNERLWVLAGRTSGSSNNIDKNDIWSTTNGEDWTEVTQAGFSRRFGQGAAVFKDKMWIVGGFDGEYKSDVWSSEDGENWKEVTQEASFEGRVSHSLVVLNNKLWLIGGRDAEENRKNDVWSSEDGENWEEVTNSTAFDARSLHATAVFCNKIWLVGGAIGSDWRNDVWYSENGQEWTKVNDEIPFNGRHSHTLNEFNNRLWIIGGFGNDSDLKNDVFAFE